MTTYRAISDTEVAVDAPLTQQLMQALKDNILAIQEGDATASGVRVALAALQSYETTPTAGDVQIAQFSIGGEHDGGVLDGDDLEVDFVIRVAGDYSLKFRGMSGSGSGANNCVFKIQKKPDGGSFSDLTSDTVNSLCGAVTRDTDQTLAVGDTIRFSLNAGNGVSGSMYGGISVGDTNAIPGVQVYKLNTVTQV